MYLSGSRALQARRLEAGGWGGDAFVDSSSGTLEAEGNTSGLALLYG